MTIELPKAARADAIASIERYFREHMEEFQYWRKYERAGKGRK